MYEHFVYDDEVKIYQNGMDEIRLTKDEAIKLANEILKEYSNRNDEGFTITCNKCGKTTKITQKKRSKTYDKELKCSNKNIICTTTNMEESFVICKCGNEIQF